MLDNAQIKVFKPAIEAGYFARVPATPVTVKQNYQPTTQGMDVGATLYFTKLFDRPVGFPKKEDRYDAPNSQYIHTETQWMETTWQFMAEFRQTAADTVGLTASDVANMGRSILQNDDALAALAKSGLTVLRITQVRSLKVVNGEGQFEDLPSFDLVVEHEDVTVTTTPEATIKTLRVKSI